MLISASRLRLHVLSGCSYKMRNVPTFCSANMGNALENKQTEDVPFFLKQLFQVKKTIMPNN